uniref:Uncharacterized protein n=1 Tax=Arundo donax TaxID=35708 RepID=A0A0A9G615_ARUDO
MGFDISFMACFVKRLSTNSR